MWIPKTETEIQQAIDQGLDETSIFDAKREIAKKSKSIATDIAAMANDGGVIIYGIDEDESGRPTQLAPIELNGAADRITQIVKTCIQEPPQIHITIIPSGTDATKGYVVVIIPPSPRAPHLVVVDKDNRFYGRDARNNFPLGEGQIAQLYKRRQDAERDRSVLLKSLIPKFDVPPHPDYAFFYLGAWPTFPAEGLIDRIPRGPDEKQDHAFFRNILDQSRGFDVFKGNYSPDLGPPLKFQRTTMGWAMSLDDQNRGLLNRRYDDALDLDINDDGQASLFCGRAAARGQENILYLLEIIIAGVTTRFLWNMGQLYMRAGYIGTVDVGIIVTGMKGAHTYENRNAMWEGNSMTEDTYERTTRVSAITLAEDSLEVARTLAMPLVRASTRGQYDPFQRSEPAS